MLIYFFIAFGLSIISTLLVKKIALKLQIVDRPNLSRKIHHQPIPLLGGFGIFVAFFLTILIIYYSTNYFRIEYIHWQELLVVFIGGSLIMIGGFLDDKYNLPAKKQIIWPIASALVVIIFGINVLYITNPLGGLIHLNRFRVSIWGFEWVILADVFTFIWLIMMMYTTKLLDGLDGLTSGVGLIAAILMFFVSLSKTLQQTDTALMSLVLAGAIAGFLIFNFHPAKLFLGESGSLFIGFMIGILAVIAGGKISTAILVMGIPLLDVVWIVLRRKLVEKKSPFTTSDKKHLHFRLLDAGFSHRSVVLFFYALSLGIGSLALIVQGVNKIFAFISLAAVMVLMGILVGRIQKKS